MSKRDKQLIPMIFIILLCFMAVLYFSLMLFGTPDSEKYHQNNINIIQKRLARTYDSEFIFLDYIESNTESDSKTVYKPYAYRFYPADNPDLVFNTYIGECFVIMVIPGKETVVKDDFPDSIKAYVYEKYASDDPDNNISVIGETNWLYHQYNVPKYYRK